MRWLGETLVDFRIGEIRDILRSTRQALRLFIGPAQVSHKLTAVLGIREMNHGLLKCLWRFAHTRTSTDHAASVKYIIARKIALAPPRTNRQSHEKLSAGRRRAVLRRR